jgi:hypothetical protein
VRCLSCFKLVTECIPILHKHYLEVDLSDCCSFMVHFSVN